MREMKDTISRRNARLVIASSFFSDLAFVLPIWLLYSINELGLSPTIATILFTGPWLVSGLFEIPTGAIADRLGRRKSFIFGNMLLLLYPVAFILGAPLALFVPILILAGIGNAFTSGTLAPLVHASYEKAGLSNKSYHKFLSNDRAVTFIARALSGATGAALYTIEPWLPFAGWLLAIVCNIIIGYYLVEKTSESPKTVSYGSHISSTLRTMAGNSLIVSTLVVYTIINIVAEAIWTGYQLFYDADGRSAFTIGMLFSVIAIVSAIGAYLIRKMYDRIHPISILFIGSGLVLMTALLLYQPLTDLRLVAILPMALASGFMMLTVTAVLQHQVQNSFQSTALSIFSVVVYALYAIASMLLGLVFDLFGSEQTRVIILFGAAASTTFVAVIAYSQSLRSTFRLEEKDVAPLPE